MDLFNNLETSLRVAVGCVAISSNILRLLRQLLRNFLAMTRDF
ncbi:hypothetical protein RFEPED_0426 [Rickettsia felis str. Pedreira]|uniref:Uncharacterized protein n=1 Tax=Rickettsia felis str. Pedreira TaxID=1359196 RepID=A0A0F3MQQ3_RICFI|nr:hypothetical protein RFEPED_0426 [Rickettsia felis str. Pedreira]